jgi:hypothetical protein
MLSIPGLQTTIALRLIDLIFWRNNPLYSGERTARTRGFPVKKYPLWVICCLFLGVSLTVAAQDAICSPKVLLAFARSGSACFSLERNQACYGNGAASVVFENASGASEFAKAGDITPLNQVSSISVSPTEDDVSVAGMLVQATSVPKNAVLFFCSLAARLFRIMLTICRNSGTATGTLNIREAPEADGDIITQLGLNKVWSRMGAQRMPMAARHYSDSERRLGCARGCCCHSQPG